MDNGRYLLDKFFDLNYGIFFDHVKDFSYAKVYSSDIITNEYNNHAEIFSLKTSPKKSLDLIEKYLQSINRKPAVYITPNTLPENTSQILEKCGYKISFNDVWMELSDNSRISEINTSLEIVKLSSDPQTVKAFRQLNQLGFSGEKSPDNPYGDQDPEEFINATIKGITISRKTPLLEGYLFKHNNDYVSCSELISDGEAGYICGVACIPQARGKGFGKTASLYAAKRSLELGNKTTFLATEFGSRNEEFYRRLGFEAKYTGSCYIKDK